MTSTSQPTTSVIGLGPMGAALARAQLRAGIPTTVWNRTPARSEALVPDGARVATEIRDTVASDLIVVCLRDHEATREVLGSLDPEAYAGRTVLNLSSTTPGGARQTAMWARERGIAYLTGAIMVPTPMIGEADASILYSGERSLFDAHVDHLRVMAGVADFVGEDPGAASLYDIAVLDVFFAGMTAFLHAVALTTEHGVDAKTFLPYAERVVALLPATFAGLAADVDAGTYPGTEDTLAMELAALEHMVDTSTESVVDTAFPVLMRDLVRGAVDRGLGGDGFSRIIEALREREKAV